MLRILSSGRMRWQQGALPLSLLADYIQLKQQPQKEFYHTDIRVLLRHNIENLL